jgi:26S proteasome regulatory subunit N7
MPSNSKEADEPVLTAEEEEKKWDPYRVDKDLGARMQMSEKLFLLRQPDELVPPAEKAALRTEMLGAIKADDMAPLFEQLAADPSIEWADDGALVARMKQANDEALAKIDAQMKDAEEQDGDLEVYDAALARADYLSKIWASDRIEAAYLAAHAKALSTGQKIDVYLYLVRTAFMLSDLALVKKYVALLEPLVAQSGDWDRRNRLRVYRAMLLLTDRRVEEAAKLLLEAVATFTCFELMTYRKFVFYAAVCSMIALDRRTNHEKVVDSPEVLAVTRTWPELAHFVESLDRCDYRGFMQSLVDAEPQWRRDRFFAPHVAYALRELRIKAYRQLLQSYRSVTLASMAESFGVGPEFLDRELSRFIASGRLNAKVDKVGQIVETLRPDAKNKQYQRVIKDGDALLNRIGKLARAINV